MSNKVFTMAENNREVHPYAINPCPFCKKDKLEVYSDPVGTDLQAVFYVHCCECDANGPLEVEVYLAINAWNKGMQYEHHQ